MVRTIVRGLNFRPSQCVGQSYHRALGQAVESAENKNRQKGICGAEQCREQHNRERAKAKGPADRAPPIGDCRDGRISDDPRQQRRSENNSDLRGGQRARIEPDREERQIDSEIEKQRCIEE